jgi:protein-S-isoprenylcysteine O-methyltransferase Ste14
VGFVAAGRSTDRSGDADVDREARGVARATRIADALRSLGAAERIAGIGALVVLASMLLPWYGLRFLSSLSQTGLDAFGFAQTGLVLTAGAALLLIVRCALGYRLPRPLSEGGLLVAAGVWAAVLIAYAMIDRPDDFAPLEISLRYGIFVALGGAVAVIVGGLRLRREDGQE